MADLARKRVLIVGAGGLGCPAALALARSGVGHIAIADDDIVDDTNLHRQLLYQIGDVGKSKAKVAALRIASDACVNPGVEIVARENRVLPDQARSLVAPYHLVIEGADNFASKFLIADACALAEVPVVQAGAVRWVGWALATLPGRSACLRCVFEDVPQGPQQGCAEAGVVGPVVGVMGALQAALAIELLSGRAEAAGVLYSYRALPGSLRRRRVARKSESCPLCSGRITDTEESRYVPPECAA